MTGSARGGRDAGRPDSQDEGGGREGRASAGSDGAAATFDVPEMDCPSCAGKVEQSVSKLDGIEDIDPRVASGRLTVTYDTGATTADDIEDRIKKAGYRVEGRSEATVSLSVPGMDCASCAGKVESALDRVDGIETHEIGRAHV